MASENPYAPPNQFKDDPNIGFRQSGLNASILTQIKIVAILMIVHGVLCLVAGAMLIGIAVVMPAAIAAQQRQMPQQPGAPSVEAMQSILVGVYGLMAAAGIIAGLLQIVAGVANLRLQGRTLGIVGLVGGVLSVGTCYCLPTAVALLVYGLIIYLNETTQRAFTLGAEGLSWDELHDLAARGLNAPEQPRK